jgi:hypothetical protein
MDLRPFRDYHESEVIQGFALAEATGSKGSLVKLQPGWNPDQVQEYTASWSRGINGVFSKRMSAAPKYTLAQSGDTGGILLGLMLYDVKETDENGKPLALQPYEERIQRQCLVSGDASPVLTRGTVYIAGMSNPSSAGPGSGAQVSNGGAGAITVVGKDVTPTIGKFLSSTGAAGFALFKLEL